MVLYWALSVFCWRAIKTDTVIVHRDSQFLYDPYRIGFYYRTKDTRPLPLLVHVGEWKLLTVIVFQYQARNIYGL